MKSVYERIPFNREITGTEEKIRGTLGAAFRLRRDVRHEEVHPAQPRIQGTGAYRGCRRQVHQDGRGSGRCEGDSFQGKGRGSARVGQGGGVLHRGAE